MDHTLPESMQMTPKEKRRAALQRQGQRLEQRLGALNQISDRFTWLRLALFVIGVAASAALFVWQGPWGFLAGALGFAALFLVVVARHNRVEASMARHKLWQQLKLAQLARMGLEWAQLPPSPFEPRADHPFEMDFDLVGERSLHRLIDTTVSQEGSERLREWLSAPIPDAAAIARRQPIVRELVPLALFRDRLTLNARLAAASDEKWRAQRLLDWFEQHQPVGWRGPLRLASGLAALNLPLFLLDRFGGLPPFWLLTGALYLLLYLVYGTRLAHLFEEAMELRALVSHLLAVFQQLERFSYRRTPHLKALCTPFLEPAQRPSHFLRGIARIVNATGAGGNPLVHLLLNLFVPWDFYFAYRLERQQAAAAQALPLWLDRWIELEALGALANLAYLNPHYIFPTIRHEAPACFEATQLGHPLLPDPIKVRNDFGSCGPNEITLITGSNMAGKSSFLRTIGASVALAYAGGPVDARALTLSLFRPFACIRVSDSVTDGISYFYAEVKCLKALLTELGREHPMPLLFFIDEIFRGTNNRERLIGSRAYIRALAGQRGIGLLSTHDLELVHLADEIPTVRNFHFRESVEDGRMRFDYTLRPGPCPTTNALLIMEMEGLPVR